ncbi:MAG: hypothetical protein JXM79_23015 [Sedimentisphaerales bacterium]|nr:hypothetical protein [Sedimentisphaerales bacterium]
MIKSRIRMRLCIVILIAAINVVSVGNANSDIPLAEHPRPDFQRQHWVNLNGQWAFQFDKNNEGLEKQWYEGAVPFAKTITVPFPWGSTLSGVKDEGDISWYMRDIQVPDSWRGQRVFLVVGACDWHTTAWLDGQSLGKHQGGYTPFEFDLTEHVTFGQKHPLVLRVDDTPHKFKLEGKQGYGRAAGIWQTVYLEARPQAALETVHFTPDIDNEKVGVKVVLDQPAPSDMEFRLEFKADEHRERNVSKAVKKGQQEIVFDVALPSPHLWSLEDPYLYEVKAVLDNSDQTDDIVQTYFGMRKISVGTLPSTDFPYVMLNNKPIYLELTLDQAYHPEGFYTFPSDVFMRDEILRTRQIGLNGQRIHIKVEVPRKLYWADKLGVLIMADVPNSWGPPDADMRRETEYALRQMVKRDYNHPCIFSWVNFNETWGLRTGKKGYTPETQNWVENVYRLTKRLDPTRLVEDNSPCNLDHVATDLNTWHAYLPGYGWKERLDQICKDTHPGSTWNFIGGRTQQNQPMLNSECGNVWGYEGSAGDVDWSWDYHIMINEFRRHPKVCGWLYTEHHDVINEWNGYWRYDRSEKFTGMDALVTDMSLRDLHGAFYIASERELCRQVSPGQTVSVPLYASFMTDADVGKQLVLRMKLSGWDTLGRPRNYWQGRQRMAYRPWMNEEIKSVDVTMPEQPGLAILQFILQTTSGTVLHRNFTTYLVADGAGPRDETIESGRRKTRIVRFSPRDFAEARWSLKQWNVLDGLKVNGAGHGYFEYRVPWPEGLKPGQIEQASFRFEGSAKQLFGKDREGSGKQEGDFMRGKGTHDPSLNPNAYPMTDEARFPSAVCVRVNGTGVGVFELPDDSADHQGILSWFSQKRDRHLREAGSYGYLVSAQLTTEVLREAFKQNELVIRLEVDEALPGGLAIYGERFGRYPLDPTILFVQKK